MPSKTRVASFLLLALTMLPIMALYTNCGGASGTQEASSTKKKRSSGAPAGEIDGSAIPQSGLRIWMKADAITGVSPGGIVTSWVNSASSNSTAVPIHSSFPIYRRGGSEINNLPYVDFTNAIMSLPSEVNIGSRHTIAVVFNKLVKPNIYYQRGSIISGGRDGYQNGVDTGVMSPLSFYGGTNIGSDPGIYYWFTDNYSGAYPAFSRTATLTMNNWHDYIMTRDGSAIDYSLDGAPRAWNSHGFTPGGASKPMGLQYIGGEYNGWQSTSWSDDNNHDLRMHGYIAEIIVYDRVVSDAERGRISDYIAYKYGF